MLVTTLRGDNGVRLPISLALFWNKNIWEVSCFFFLKAHKTVENHAKLAEILMSNMTALTDFLQINQQLLKSILLYQRGNRYCPSGYKFVLNPTGDSGEYCTVQYTLHTG